MAPSSTSDDRAGEASSSRDGSETDPVSGQRGLVWIVDDSPLEAEMARRAISPSNDVASFEDGAMMLERLADGVRPDALVLDWQLPGMSGIEVCRFLRGTLSQIDLPILMLTVHGHQQDVVDGLASGANDYVTKPYDPSELVARVRTLVHTRRLHERARRAECALKIEIDEHKRAEQALDFLSQASIALVSSLDSKAASASMARLAVPQIADYCGVYLLDGTNAERLVEDAGTPSTRGERLTPLAVSHPLFVNAPAVASSVLGSGSSELVSDVGEALAWATGSEALRLNALQEAGVASWLVVPLAIQGRPYGCVVLAITGSARRFDTVDLALAEELGRRTAIAIDNARLFEMSQRERARVEEANRIKDEFLATVSHELRTPLNAILGWVVMLRSYDMTEEKRGRALATIERAAKSQAQLIEDLLDISRIISGKLRLNVTPIQPFEVIESALETVRPSADAKEIRIQPVLDPNAGPVMGDPERLQQVVWNLLSNAVKFTPKGGRIKVYLRRVGSDLHIVVADNGRGIAPEFLPYIFDRFRQADMSISRGAGGLGLGLAITRHLVELHGGAIEAASPGPGLGTTVTVKLPVASLRGATRSSSDHPSAPPASAVFSSLISPPELDGLRVLVVDDEPDARELIRSILEASKARVTSAGSVAEAFEALRRELPDVLVSDVGMAGETGYDLIRKVRSLPADKGGRMPAVALTAYARMEDRTRALLMGFDIHVPKPIEPSELLVVIAHLATRFSKQ
jgi:signal transduction histidine kinase/DNA-binding response OmpR family regulator